PSITLALLSPQPPVPYRIYSPSLLDSLPISRRSSQVAGEGADLHTFALSSLERLQGRQAHAHFRHSGTHPSQNRGRVGHPGFRSDRKSTRLNSSHQIISYAVFCLKKKRTSR